MKGIILVLVLVILASGCIQPPQPTPSPSPTATLEPTATPQATPTAIPTTTPSPTTVPSPEPTTTPTPTLPTPTPVQQPEEKPSSTWTGEGVVVPGGYCDAEVVKLPDGRYRMYYGLDPRTYPENINIVSAVSSDGLNWAPEPGTRLPEGYTFAMASVIELPDGRWRMYYNSGGIRSSISDDGINFQAEGLRLETDHQGPSVIRLDDGRYRMYLQGGVEAPPPAPPVGQIESAISPDGLSWEMEPGARVDLQCAIGTPDVVKLSDGSFQLYFLAGSEKMAEEGVEGVYRVESADGLSFSNATFVFGNYVDEEGREVVPADPCVAKMKTGWRMYYACCVGTHSKGIGSAAAG